MPVPQPEPEPEPNSIMSKTLGGHTPRVFDMREFGSGSGSGSGSGTGSGSGSNFDVEIYSRNLVGNISDRQHLGAVVTRTSRNFLFESKITSKKLINLLSRLRGSIGKYII